MNATNPMSKPDARGPSVPLKKGAELARISEAAFYKDVKRRKVFCPPDPEKRSQKLIYVADLPEAARENWQSRQLQSLPPQAPQAEDERSQHAHRAGSKHCSGAFQGGYERQHGQAACC